jgi:hypothetical protein
MVARHVIEQLTLVIPRLIVSHGEDRGPYINLDFESENPKADWMKIRSLLEGVTGLASCCIVTCQGRNDWDDYLLLHHFDPDEPCDDMLEEF